MLPEARAAGSRIPDRAFRLSIPGLPAKGKPSFAAKLPLHTVCAVSALPQPPILGFAPATNAGAHRVEAAIPARNPSALFQLQPRNRGAPRRPARAVLGADRHL